MRSARRASVRAAGALAVLGLATLAGCGGGEDAAPGTSIAPAPMPTPTGGAGSSPLEPTSAPGATSAPSDVSPGNPGTGATPSGTSSVAAPVPWDTGALPPAASVSKAPSGAAKLSILLDDGFGIRSIWTLNCDPAGGTHPEPATACGVLGANGAKALPAPSPDTACTEQYGGPQKAKITGTWRGKAVNAELSLENGCQISRWSALLGLLPPGGIAQ